MELIVVTEQRFYRAPDGGVWATGNPYRFWQRYLEVFSAVTVVARLGSAAAVVDSWQRSDGPGVAFCEVPHYRGPLEYLRRRRKILEVSRRVVGNDGAIIMRVPSTLANGIFPMLKNRNRPFALEVVGDPSDVFAPGSVPHPGRRLFRWWFSRNLRRQCLAAAAVAYVTDGHLQGRYPAGPGAFSAAYTSGGLASADFVDEPRTFERSARPLRLITVGSLEQPYKGVDVLIDAVSLLVSRGVSVTLRVLGEGRLRDTLEGKVRRLGVEKQVSFLGQVRGGEAVRRELDEADIFVLASRTEGLPRAMIEAMARGLPCVGTAVGGIPELLSPDCLVPPGNAPALAEKIAALAASEAAMNDASARNVIRSRNYAESTVSRLRTEFYRQVARCSLRT